jgi:hypothetical protein
MKRGFKNKAKTIVRTLNCIKRIEYLLEVVGTEDTYYKMIKETAIHYKLYLNQNRKVNTFRTADLSFINTLMNGFRIYLKIDANRIYGMKKEDK